MEYRIKNILLDICEKGIIKKNLCPYPGIAGIYDYQPFWKKMNEGGKTAILQGETYGIRYLLDNSIIKTYETLNGPPLASFDYDTLQKEFVGTPFYPLNN